MTKDTQQQPSDGQLLDIAGLIEDIAINYANGHATDFREAAGLILAAQRPEPTEWDKAQGYVATTDWSAPAQADSSPMADSPVEQLIADESDGAWAAFEKSPNAEMSNRDDLWQTWHEAWVAARSAAPTPIAQTADVQDERGYWHGRIRKWRDAFDAMHRRAMRAEERLRELETAAAPAQSGELLDDSEIARRLTAAGVETQYLTQAVTRRELWLTDGSIDVRNFAHAILAAPQPAQTTSDEGAQEAAMHSAIKFLSKRDQGRVMGALRAALSKPSAVEQTASDAVDVRATTIRAAASKPLVRCAAGRDGECSHTECPQLRDGEPVKSRRHCPLDAQGDES